MSFETKNNPLVYLIVIVAVFITGVFLFLFGSQSLGSGNNWTNTSTLLRTTLAVLALMAAYVRFRTTPDDSLIHTVFLGLVVAWFFYLVGELSNVVYLFILSREPPYPSFGDPFFLLGTVLLFEQLLQYARQAGQKITKRQMTAIFAAVGAFVLTLLGLVFWDVMWAKFTTDYTPIQKSLDIFYFSLDVFILYASLYILTGIFTQEGSSPPPIGWFLLIGGMLSLVIADTIFFYIEFSGSTEGLFIFGDGYRLEDVFYIFQYFFWTVGAVFIKERAFEKVVEAPVVPNLSQLDTSDNQPQDELSLVDDAGQPTDEVDQGEGGTTSDLTGGA